MKMAILPDEGATLRQAWTPVPHGAAEHLKAMISERQLGPGDRLPAQRQLAEQLGISRASLREAVTALETMGLITVQPGRGVFVAAPSSGAAAWRFSDRASPHDVYEARYCLEAFAAGMATARLDRDKAALMKHSVAALREAVARSDVAAMAAADSAFHDLIIEVCANPILTAMYKSVRELMTESQKLPMHRSVGLEETALEHEVLLARIEAGDQHGASEAMRTHIRNAARRYGLVFEGVQRARRDAARRRPGSGRRATPIP